MVRYFKYTKAFLRLVRIQNLLIIAVTMYVLRYLVFVPLLKNDGFAPQLSEKLFFLLALSTVLITAAGYVINDYFDRKTDLINRPGKVILGRLLSRRAGMFWHIVLTTAGILLGLLVAYKIGHLKYSVIFILVSGVLWFYSTTYKRQVLLGNVIVAVLVAMVPLIVLLFELPLLIEKYGINYIVGPTHIDLLIHWILGYALFAFLLTLIREITKDLEDFEGDFAFGRQTIPIAWGDHMAKRIVLALCVVTISLLLFAIYKFRWSYLTVWYGLFIIILPIVFFMRGIVRAKSREDYSNSSKLLKLIMVAGVLFTVLAAFWVF